VYGFAEANKHYERALSLWEQVAHANEQVGITLADLRLEAAEAAHWAGLADWAVTQTKEALADLGPRLEPAQAAVLHARLAEYLWDAGDTKAALATYEEASRLVANEAASAEKARVLAGHATELMRQGHFTASHVLCEKAVVVARAVGARVEEAHALNTLGCDLSALGDSEAGIASLRQALAMAEQVNSVDEICRAYLNLSEVIGTDAGQLQEGLSVIRRGLGCGFWAAGRRPKS
jgi:tetratricopeptide (TPR) repeat protein